MQRDFRPKPQTRRERQTRFPLRTRRVSLLLTLGLVGAWGVVSFGCGRDRADKRVEIRYMAWGTPEQLGVEQQLVNEFMRQNPDVLVRLFKVPQSAYVNKMVIMLASRTAPDVIRVDHYNFPDFVRKDYFRDLTPLARADSGFHATDFFPPTIAEGTVNGKLYGLSTLQGGVILYYNQSMFRQAGLADPYELAKRGEWTWARLRDDALKLTQTDAGGRTTRFGLLLPTFPQSVTALWAWGGDLLTPDETRSALDNPQAAQAYQFLADLRWRDHVCPTPSQGALSAVTFESGKVGMVLDYMGLAPRLRKAVKNFEWDICPVPRGPQDDRTVLKGNQLVMYQECEHPQEAWRFMRFLTGPEAETLLYGKLRRCAPSRKAVASSPAFLHADAAPFHTGVYLSAFQKGRELPINPRWAEWTTAMNSEMDNLWSGRERDARVVLRRAASKVNAVLESEEGF